MCMPYLIPDPPPKKRFKPTSQSSEKSSPSEPSEPLRPQPAFIEISPRLTYVASPKASPRRSKMPARRRPSGEHRARPSPQKNRHVEGSVGGKHGSQEGSGSSKEGKGEAIGIGIDIEKKECATGPPQQPKATSNPPSPIPPPAPSPPPPAKKSPPPTEAGKSLKPPAPLVAAPPQKKEQPSPPSQAPKSAHPLPPQSTRPPHTHRPPPHHHPHSHHHPHPHSHSRSPSTSTSSSLSRRSFDRLKRNMGIVWERLKELEKWKHDREQEDAERGRRRVGWEFGLSGVRNQSRIRDRERREISVVRDRMVEERQQEMRWQRRRDEERDREKERQRIRDEDARKERERQMIRDEDAHKLRDRQRIEDLQRQRGMHIQKEREYNQHFEFRDQRGAERPVEIRRESTQVRLGERWG